MSTKQITPNLARIGGHARSGLTAHGGTDKLGLALNTTGTDSQINDANQLVLPSSAPPLVRFRQIWNTFQDFQLDRSGSSEIELFGDADSGNSGSASDRFYVHHIHAVTWCWSWSLPDEGTYFNATGLSGVFEVGYGSYTIDDYTNWDGVTEFPPGIVTVFSHPFDTAVDHVITASGSTWFDPPLVVEESDTALSYIHMRPGDASINAHYGLFVD